MILVLKWPIITFTFSLLNDRPLFQAELLKVAGCRRKSPATWLVSAGYSAWHFFTDGIF